MFTVSNVWHSTTRQAGDAKDEGSAEAIRYKKNEKQHNDILRTLCII
ncbi:hypothetical protein SCFA_760003 [anaerobic digester metagenome]|uniref:Uncharacterized protein n=1 Tax=anaerobic digester metagenome TaxID=1263854 RepID=A0A485M448_9ZZZZ